HFTGRLPGLSGQRRNGTIATAKGESQVRGKVAGIVEAGRRELRRAVLRMAPPGSPQRSLVDYVTLLARHGALLPISPRQRNRPPWPDLGDRAKLEAFVEPFGVRLDE